VGEDAMRTKLLVLFSMGLFACHAGPSEPVTAPEAAAPRAPRPPSTHVIAESDHRKLVKLAQGDFLELPSNPDFEWTLTFDNHSYFDDAPASEAGITRYVASRTGIVPIKVRGEPKACMHSDAACPTAIYNWSINVAVE
jgi:hypothetical protein